MVPQAEAWGRARRAVRLLCALLCSGLSAACRTAEARAHAHRELLARRAALSAAGSPARGRTAAAARPRSEAPLSALGADAPHRGLSVCGGHSCDLRRRRDQRPRRARHALRGHRKQVRRQHGEHEGRAARRSPPRLQRGPCADGAHGRARERAGRRCGRHCGRHF